MCIYLKNRYRYLQERCSVFPKLYFQDVNATSVHTETKALIVWKSFQMDDVLMNINYLCFITVNRVAP